MHSCLQHEDVLCWVQTRCRVVDDVQKYSENESVHERVPVLKIICKMRMVCVCVCEKKIR